MSIDWSSIFVLQTPILEIFIRGTVVYLSVYVLFRLVVLRMGASMSIGNILITVMVADAVSNGIQGEYLSVTGALILAATIIFWDAVIEILQQRVKLIGRILEGKPVLIVHEGRFLHGNMRRHFISEHEIMTALREEGSSELNDVREAYLETDGKISIIPKK